MCTPPTRARCADAAHCSSPDTELPPPPADASLRLPSEMFTAGPPRFRREERRWMRGHLPIQRSRTPEALARRSASVRGHATRSPSPSRSTKRMSTTAACGREGQPRLLGEVAGAPPAARDPPPAPLRLGIVHVQAPRYPSPGAPSTSSMIRLWGSMNLPTRSLNTSGGSLPASRLRGPEGIHVGLAEQPG